MFIRSMNTYQNPFVHHFLTQPCPSSCLRNFTVENQTIKLIPLARTMETQTLRRSMNL